MKKFLLSLTLFALTSSVFANCLDAYLHASKVRRNTTYAVVGVATVASAGGAIAIGTGAVASLLVVGYEIGLISVLPSIKDIDNTFDKILDDFYAAQKGELTSHTERLIKKAVKARDEDTRNISPATQDKALALLAEGFQNETFCPVVKIKHNGEEKRAVFNKKALVKYLADNL